MKNATYLRQVTLVGLVLHWLPATTFGLVTEEGIDRDTLRRWVGEEADPDLELSLVDGPAFLRFESGDEAPQGEGDILRKVSKFFASDTGRIRANELKGIDEEFDTFEQEERRNKQVELCDMGVSSSSMVSEKTAQCLCGNEESFIHCEALLEQEAQGFLDPTGIERTSELRIELKKTDILTLCEVEVFSNSGALLQLTGAQQSTTTNQAPADRAIDGNKNQSWGGSSCTHTANEQDPWWTATVVYQANDPPARIVVYNRNVLQNRLAGFSAYLDGTAIYSSSDAKSVYDGRFVFGRALNKAVSTSAIAKSSAFPARCEVTTCEIAGLEFCDNLGSLDLLDFYGFLNSLSNYAFLEQGGAVEMACSVKLPPPLPLEVHLGVSLRGGGLNVQTLQVTHNQAESTYAGITGEVCLPGAKEELASPLFDVLEFLGVSRCFLRMEAALYPLLGTLQASLEANLFIVKTNIDLTWMYEDDVRNELQICSGVTSCSQDNKLDCAMCQGETFVSGKITLRILFWDVSFVSNSHSIEGCRTAGEGDTCVSGLAEPECWKDGDFCLALTSCNNCCTPYTFWIGKFTTACGIEPCWPDGTVCLAGTSCHECCNKAYNAGGTQCGGTPWPDGSICALGTTCDLCANPATFWVGKFITACGTEPCWPDRTVCLAGTSCDQCCNRAYNAGGTQCGGRAWADGTACGIGTTCNLCKNGYSWWIGKAFTACGREPCWKRGTVCGLGTTCNSCCRGSNCPWYWFGVCECK